MGKEVTVKFDAQQQDIIIAALRCYQAVLEDRVRGTVRGVHSTYDAVEWRHDLEQIATNCDEHEAPSAYDIDVLLGDVFGIAS
jgi:hypothetical protein